MNKPQSIRRFDMLYLGSIAISLVGVVLTFGDMMEMMQAEMSAQGVDFDGTAILIGGFAFGLAINLALWFLVSVLRVEIVKWVIAVFVAYGALSILLAAGTQPWLSIMFGALSTAMMVAAVWFLFRPDSKAWFAEKRNKGDS